MLRPGRRRAGSIMAEVTTHATVRPAWGSRPATRVSVHTMRASVPMSNERRAVVRS